MRLTPKEELKIKMIEAEIVRVARDVCTSVDIGKHPELFILAHKVEMLHRFYRNKKLGW